MINVVGDADILAEELLAHAFVEAGAFVRERGGCEIVEEKADEIEHGGGFEDDRVTAGGKLVGVEGEMCFFTDSRGEFQGVKGANFARADWLWPFEKIPAATWPFLTAKSQARRTARARSSAERAAVCLTKRFTVR